MWRSGFDLTRDFPDTISYWPKTVALSAVEDDYGLGRPEIFNTDQGSQFTARAFTGVLEGHGIRISMDGKGRFMDNIFVERL